MSLFNLASLAQQEGAWGLTSEALHGPLTPDFQRRFDAMHAYRSHTCGQLRATDVGAQVRLSGWVHRKRDHGNLLFVDLRDHYGITQFVLDTENPAFKTVEAFRPESVVTLTGKVVAREPSTVNPKLPTGEIEVRIEAALLQSASEVLPFQVAQEGDYPEEMRLKYRFLDLRTERLHANIVLRSQVIASMRRRMIDQGFTEFQTPILTSSSPEGRARLSGAVASASGQVLRAAAGAAAVQAIADGRGLRSLFPDRALLPRRRRARRPLARRILPARFRDELRHAGRRVRGDRARAARRVRRVLEGPQGHQAAVPSASPSTTRCSNTVPTSPICATRW
jgi:hypothetical protein